MRPSSIRIARRPVDEGVELPGSLHPVLARVLRGRGVRSAAELDHSLARLEPFHALSGIERGAAVLAEAADRGARVLVVGDFDADGATACAVLVRGLRGLGFAHVDFLVPNRFEYGYGLTPALVDAAAARAPELIVTVDHGVTSVEGVAAANARGIPVIVTDHHLPGSRLPDAAAIVDPNLPGDPFPSKSLAGVGVAFYLLAALRARLRGSESAGGGGPNLAALLDLVALGTVADVVPLDHNNRILVEQGLRRIRVGRGSPGVRALLEVARRDPARAVASDLAFAAAPRLNAAGRITDMSIGIECLLADDPARAGALAARLDALNRERRDIEARMQAQAEAAIESITRGSASVGGDGIVLYEPTWHPGVVGIVAARIKDRTGRPVVALAPADGGWVRGSARSVPGLHVRDALARVDALHPGLLARFGGHAMAAGVTLDASGVDTFAAAFDDAVREMTGDAARDATIWTDGALGASDIDLPLARTLREAAPWGQGFPEPTFDGEFAVRARRIVGGDHLRLDLACPGRERSVRAIAFRAADAPESARMRLVYRLDVNRWREEDSAQLVVEHLIPARGDGS